MSSENQFLAQRREKAQTLADLGVKLYSNTFKPADRISDLLPKAEQLEPQQKEEGGATYSIAGRIMAMRKFGKAAFFTLADEITIDVLKAANLVPAIVTKVKVIKSGEIKKAVKLKGLKVTKGAREEIEKAGGSIED